MEQQVWSVQLARQSTLRPRVAVIRSPAKKLLHSIVYAAQRSR